MNNANNKLEILRHSAAHLLAHAITDLYPGTKITLGPATPTGFFYDVLPAHNFTNKDIPLIEQRMHELAAKDYPIIGEQVPKEKARQLYKDNPFKLEIIDNIDGDTVGIYYQGDFFDLCRGGHVGSLGEIKHFRLTGISGSYWRADRSGTALQRISGVAFLTKEDLDNYFSQLEEAKKRDHRFIGQQLDLFSFHEEAPGAAFFHDKGLKIYNALIDYSRSIHKDTYLEIKTPIINNESLYKISGHYDNYLEHAYTTTVDDVRYWIRPMNCPSCVLWYQEKPHSYRELPLRVAEYGLVHRYELSGVLHGLFRVRSFTIDDAHIFCTPSQIEDEVIAILNIANKMYQRFDFKQLHFALSTRPEKSIGTDAMWEKSINSLRNALNKLNIPFSVQEGEGAFYGPKIEIKVEDCMDRQWQCGTIQVDFNMPERFDLTYITSEQKYERPVMIHRAIYGSIERFLGIITEHYKGQFPLWLAPVQARILTITDEQNPYAQEIAQQLRTYGLRVEIDTSGDQISKQIRNAQHAYIPWMLVIGKKEVNSQTITLRHLDGTQEANLTVQSLYAKIKE